MKYFASTLNLKNDPALIQKYIDHHKNVWPGILKSVRRSGITQCKIFICGRQLFMYMETTDDYDPKGADNLPNSYTPEEKELDDQWQELMQNFQEQIPGHPKDMWWIPMDEIFDLDGA